MLSKAANQSVSHVTSATMATTTGANQSAMTPQRFNISVGQLQAAASRTAPGSLNVVTSPQASVLGGAQVMTTLQATPTSHVQATPIISRVQAKPISHVHGQATAASQVQATPKSHVQTTQLLPAHSNSVLQGNRCQIHIILCLQFLH